eukprot:TRINITY_DN43570_c0_g1_i1.p1 TRINITY_DN43570_c0_g1~~TRINITY_DN43570_c0_g1_i1.p1  ORF type:complete len:471 (+),score=43.00 TRINITY_DN43570_c0_g1_i1:42-1454(+)
MTASVLPIDEASCSKTLRPEEVAAKNVFNALSQELDVAIRTASREIGLWHLGANFKAGIAGQLAVAECSCFVGFYTNAQVIANLLHLVVQLSLFPWPERTETSVQIGAHTMSSSAQTDTPVKRATAPALTPPASAPPSRPPSVPPQRASAPKPSPPKAVLPKKKIPVRRRTPQKEEVERRAPSPPREIPPKEIPRSPPRSPPSYNGEDGSHMGVRIGGGYHISPRLSPMEQLNVASQARTRSRSPSPSRTMHERSSDEDTFGMGLPTYCVPPERFAVGAYAPSSNHVEKVITHDARQAAVHDSLRDHKNLNLYRVLKPHQANGQRSSSTPDPPRGYAAVIRDHVPLTECSDTSSGQLYPAMKTETNDELLQVNRRLVGFPETRALFHEADLYMMPEGGDASLLIENQSAQTEQNGVEGEQLSVRASKRPSSARHSRNAPSGSISHRGSTSVPPASARNSSARPNSARSAR